MSDYAPCWSLRRHFARCRTAGRRLLYASLVVTVAAGLGCPVPPAHASARAPGSIHKAPATGRILPMAFLIGLQTRNAFLAQHETPVTDAWLPGLPEASFAPMMEPALEPTGESAVSQDMELPLRAHCSPNPFATSTSVMFELPQDARVALTVHDGSGREVRHLSEGEEYAAGSHLVRWDGRDDFGREVESGTYTIRLRFER